MSEPLLVRVEFETPEEPITGTISIEGVRRPFTGWLGLMSGLRGAVDEQGALDSVAVRNGENDP